MTDKEKHCNAYREWRKALMKDKTLLDIAIFAVAKPYGVDIRLLAICIADYGIDGRECFAAAETVAEVMGCSVRTVKARRAELIDLGWFKIVGRSGGFNNRGLVLEIARPDV